MAIFDLSNYGDRCRQFLGGSVNGRSFFGFILTEESGYNSFILQLDIDDYYRRRPVKEISFSNEEVPNRVSSEKTYLNPDFNEFRYIVMTLLNGEESNDIFESLYYGLMCQTTDMDIHFRASELFLKMKLSGVLSNLRQDFDLIYDVINTNLISSDKEYMLRDIWDSIQAILMNYEYKQIGG